jgi:hypothetical protein
MRGRPRSRVLTLGAGLALLAAACTSGDESTTPEESEVPTQTPAPSLAQGWEVQVTDARAETALDGRAGTYRPNPGDAFVVVDTTLRSEDENGSFSTHDATLLGDASEHPAMGGGNVEMFCVECELRRTVGQDGTDFSFVFVISEQELAEDFALRLGDLDPVALTVRAGESQTAVHTPELTLLANLPTERPTISSDLAFWGVLAFAGSYDGFRVIDVSNPAEPSVIADVRCRNRQGDISVWENLVFVSTDTPTSTSQCDGEDVPAGSQGAWEGIRIFDVSDPSDPTLIRSVRTDCGSHTHTLVPDPSLDRVLLYVSSYPNFFESLGPSCQAPFERISVVEVPLDAPERARVVAEPSLEGTEVFDWGTDEIENGVGCHDITVFMPLDLAAAACMSEGQIWDISDPVVPRVVARIDNPQVSFWHSAAFSWDGEVVAFGDEYFFGEPGCQSTTHGAIWFYRVSDPAEPLGHYTLPRDQGDDREQFCTAHNFDILPVQDRYVMVSAFYIGGVSVIDFTDPAQPREIAYYDAVVPRGADVWSAYWYDGGVYASDIGRGVDVFDLRLPDVERVRTLGHLNPQTQEILIR